MSFEEKQIHKLNKQLNAKEEQHKRQKSIMIQKIELLQSQIMDYQEKDMKNRQLNESIIMSYKQNDSFRQQCNYKEMNALTQRHQQEIKSLKRRHSDQKKRLEDEIHHLKEQNDRLKLDIERIHLQNEKAIAQIKNQYEQKLTDKNNDMNNIFLHKFQLINQRLRQSQEMNNLLKSQLESKKERNCPNIDKNYFNIDENQERMVYFDNQNRKASLTTKKNQQNYQILKKTEQTISSINLRINRALVQLNPNKIKMNDRIKKIRERVYDQQ